MNILIILSILSFLGALYMLWRKISLVALDVEGASEEAHTNFIVDFFHMLRQRTIAILTELYLKAKPHVHDFISVITSRAYKLSSWFAHESLKLHNFIQGRRVLRNSGNTSIFIRDITRHKENHQVNHKVTPL